MCKRARAVCHCNDCSVWHTDWVRIGLGLVATGYCWNGWLHGDVAMTAILPFVHWFLAAHTCHEATHATLSTNQHVNYWLQFTAHP